MLLLSQPRVVALSMIVGLWGGFLFGASSSATAAERCVLIEDFNATWCVPCHTTGGWLSQMQDLYPTTMALLQEHVSYTDVYALSWGRDRLASYPNAVGIPNAWFDGAQQELGTVPGYSGYLNAYLAEQATPTDVTIELGAEQIEGPMYKIKARVGLETGGVPKTVRLYVVRALDHFPVLDPYTCYRNCLMEVVEPNNTAILDLVPGQRQTIERTTTFDTASWADPNDIRVLAWVQAPDPNGVRQVYQAKKISWPLAPLLLPGDLNCDGNVNYADINPFVMALQSESAYQNKFPNCPRLNADCNGDGMVTYADINWFVALLGSH